MDISSIINWTWGAIASGIAGGAAYDGLKAVLGGFYSQLSRNRQQNQRAEFENLLHTLLESNAEMRGQLADLAQGKTDNSVFIVKTGDIRAEHGSNVQIGNFSQG